MIRRAILALLFLLAGAVASHAQGTKPLVPVSSPLGGQMTSANPLKLNACTTAGQTWVWNGTAFVCTAVATGGSIAGTVQRLARFSGTGASLADSPVYGDTTNNAVGISAAPLPPFMLSLVNTGKFGMYIRTCSTCGGEQPAMIVDSGVTGQPVRTMISSEGVLVTNAWMTISGGFHAAVDHVTGAFGISSLGLPTTDPYMLGVMSDVDGPTVVVRGSSDTHNRLLDGMDVAGNIVWSLGKDGKVQWGAGAYGALDTNLYRNAANSLMTDGIFSSNTQVAINAGANQIPITMSSNAAVNIAMNAVSGTKVANIVELTTGAFQLENRASGGSFSIFADGLFRIADYNGAQATRFSVDSSSNALAAGYLAGAEVRTNGASGSRWRSGTGVPAISCAVGDTFSRTDGASGTSYYFCTATNTWTAASTGGGGGPGTGTAGTLPYWATTTTLGDSIIAQASSIATITGGLTVTGRELWSGSQTTSTLGNDFSLNATTSTLYVTTSGITLTGLTGGVTGRILRLVNKGAVANDYITISNDSGSSSAGNRIYGPDATAVRVDNSVGATLIYDTDHWRVVANGSQTASQVTSVSDAYMLGDLYIAGNGRAAATTLYGWGSAQYYTALDTGVGRNAAGVVEFNNGTLHTLRDAIARNLTATTLGLFGSGSATSTAGSAALIVANAGTTGFTVRDTTNSREFSVLTGAGATKVGTFTSDALNVVTNNTTAMIIAASNQDVAFASNVIGPNASPPTISSCGTSPTVVGNNNGFIITVGATATSCTATFSHAFTTGSVCSATSNDSTIGTVYLSASSSSAITIAHSGTGFAGDKLYVTCWGY